MMIISTLNKNRINKKIYLWGIYFLFLAFFCQNMAQASSRESEMKDAKIIREDSPFGVLEFLHWNHAWNNYKYPDEKSLKRAIGLMKDAGVAWVRIDFLWDEIEPEPGKFEFKKYDAIVDLLIKNNIGILGIWGYSAPWASSCGAWNSPPSDNKNFVAYAVKTAEHYQGKVDYWELWNEPDSRTYWSQQDGLKGYCDLLKDVYPAVKAAVPGCKILNGGFSNAALGVNRLYDNGAKDYFDIMNIHIFESPLNLGAVKAVGSYPKLVYKIMSRNGDAKKKIWVSEIGCPGVKRDEDVKAWWLGKNPSEKQQAEWLKDVYGELLKQPAVEKVFWAFFRDTDRHWDNGVDYFGLIRWNYSKKPAFISYQKCVRDWLVAR